MTVDAKLRGVLKSKWNVPDVPFKSVEANFIFLLKPIFVLNFFNEILVKVVFVIKV